MFRQLRLFLVITSSKLQIDRSSIFLTKPRPQDTRRWFTTVRNNAFIETEINFDIFQVYPNALRFNRLQLYQSVPLLGFSVFFFFLNSCTVTFLSYYKLWSSLKSPKIA